MIRIGTSGFSYKDWMGKFYPEGTQDRDRLRVYAEHFDTVEINASYYNIGHPRIYSAMAKKVPDEFEFVVKANQAMTHDRELNKAVFREFLDSVLPLIEEGKFGCVLAQFPWSFKRNPENEDYLRTFRGRIEETPTVIEFRNREWCEPEIHQLLRELGFGYCCVDEPKLKGLMPPESVVTSDLGYVRFHGRNAKKWWKHDEAWERYDYLYEKEELEEWAPKIKSVEQEAEQEYVFFNNHYQGQAATNAQMLLELLA